MQKSEELYRRAVELMPAGVNSPVRAFKSVGGTPIFMTGGEGAYMFDVDGNRYLDFCGSWGPLILGHGQHEVAAAIHEVVDKGWTFGTPVPQEVELAALIVDKLRAVEMVRFVNSGTEAVMSAIRLARGFTGRDRILKFRGCYHGHADYLMVDAGSGLATFGTASSAGVPQAFAQLTATMPLADVESLEAFFAGDGDQLACVVIEGVPANNGLLVQDGAYVQRLAELCREKGALLIFDEVLSGFRMPEVMAYEHYGVTPDLVTLGKVIGGGMPVGAYGGRKEIMSRIAPLGDVYQAGTLSGNPVAMAAGFATLRHYFAKDVPAQIEVLGKELDQAMDKLLAPYDQMGYLRMGSLFWFFFGGKQPPKQAEAIASIGAQIYARLHAKMLQKGIYLAPSAYEVGFLNTAMTVHDIHKFADALHASLQEGIFSC